MKPTKHKASGLWCVRIPSKLSETGKRQIRYYSSEAKARDDIKSFKSEKMEHGRSGVTAEERRWIGFLRESIGDLERLPSIVEHWKRTGERLNQIDVKDAVKEFLDSAEKDYPNHRTLNDIKERLEKFKAAFFSRLVHEVSPTDIERFLEMYSPGWDRWSYHKRLGPFFKLAKRRRWIVINPMEEVPKPKTPTPERQIYTAQQFSDLLHGLETPTRREIRRRHNHLLGPVKAVQKPEPPQSDRRGGNNARKDSCN